MLMLIVLINFSIISCGGSSFTNLEDSQSASSESLSGDLEKEDQYAVEIEPIDQLEEIPVEETPPEAPQEVVAPPDPLSESILLACEDTESSKPITAKIDQEISLSISGDVCPTPLAQDPSILFIVDVSGSMTDQQANIFSPVVPGADKFENGTCGRYEAIKAILEKTKSGAATQTGRAGVILFGSDIHENSILFTDLANFEAQLRPENICIATNGTNYEQAFVRAKEWLDAEQGELKIAYFISDGIPTEINNNNNPSQDEINVASIAAGKALTEVAAGALAPKLFQVFLGPANPDNLVVMEGIAGDTKDTTIAEVEKASDLAKVLTDFSLLDLEIGDISLFADDASPIAVTKFEQIETGANAKWAWEAESIVIPVDVNELQLKLELIHENTAPISTVVTIPITRN